MYTVLLSIKDPSTNNNRKNSIRLLYTIYIMTSNAIYDLVCPYVFVNVSFSCTMATCAIAFFVFTVVVFSLFNLIYSNYTMRWFILVVACDYKATIFKLSIVN